MLNKYKNNILDEILVDLAMQLYPEFLLNENKGKMDQHKNKKIIEKYNKILNTVNSAWQKTLQYQYVFSEFYYENGNIDKFAQLEHHVHAYLQDTDTLKNKIETLFDNLKKDVKVLVVNKIEIVEFFQAGKEKTVEVFDKISKHRNAHVHYSHLFADSDILKAEDAERTLNLLKHPSVIEKMGQTHLSEVIAKLTKDKNEGFEKAKERWIKNTKKNIIQTTGFIEFVLKIIKPVLYKAFEIAPLKK